MPTYINIMPQTSNGAGGNPWIQYMRACAANYRAGHTQHQSVEGRPVDVEASEKPPAERRITKNSQNPKPWMLKEKPQMARENLNQKQKHIKYQLLGETGLET